ncbi:hypothetical protein ABT224_20165 [Streptomyces sp. NPDC001584]|uniref:hypothetical protein n=1 Tax=Streptomyces sp. NPDC001584 TaxID=3154521 RepID=UPI003327A05B
MTQVRRITDNLVPLLMGIGGLVVARLALALAAQHEAHPAWHAAAALLAYTLTVALLGRIGGEDPYEAVADATRALAYVLQAALAGALQILCTTVQLLAVLCGGLAALTAPATS